MIVASAIKLSSGSVYVGKRHGDVVENIYLINKNETESLLAGCKTGFINDKLEFLDREKAYYEAFAEGQCKEQKETPEFIRLMENSNLPKDEWKPCLASEDLW